MITVFGGWPSRSQRVLWLLEELGTAYAFHPVDPRRRQSDGDFLSANPAGFLPAIADGEVRLCESVAIMEYLLARHGSTSLAPGPAEPAFARYQQFLHLGEAGMAAYLNIVVASRFIAPEAERRNWGAETAVAMFFNRLSLVATRLAASPHLAGEDFTAADISVCYALELGERLGLAERYDPPVSAYMRRLAEREAYQRALAVSPPRSPGA
jgi:glutathione S-transferase